jgi:hypothetical protein
VPIRCRPFSADDMRNRNQRDFDLLLLFCLVQLNKAVNTMNDRILLLYLYAGRLSVRLAQSTLDLV